jgi:hypothetical protein
MKPNWRTHAILLAALVALNVAVKITLWAQPPQTFPDSLGYIAPAMRVLDGLGYGSQENGFRTPTYPLFIAAIVAPFNHSDLSGCREARVPACLGEAQKEPSGQVDLRAVVTVQIVLGLLTILLVYGFAWRVSHNPWIAAACAATYPIDLATGYWEISLLTDTLTTFLLALAVYLTPRVADSTRHRLSLSVVLGIVLAALALCHSVYLLYAVVPAAFVWLAAKSCEGTQPCEGSSPRWRGATLARFGALPVLLIPALFVLAWSARNYVVDGYFTPSTISGYNLTQMVGPFMEQAPAAYRDLADIYLDYRGDRIAARGTHSGTIFLAYRDMMNVRQLTWAGLSQTLATMSAQMIAANPAGYLQTAGAAFVQFWKFGLGRQNSGWPLSYEWVKWFLDTRVHEALMVLFWAALPALGFRQWRHREDRPAALWIWFAVTTVLYAAFFSSALNFGDNERYRTHVARLQYSAAILTAWLYARAWIAGRHISSLRRLT